MHMLRDSAADWPRAVLLSLILFLTACGGGGGGGSSSSGTVDTLQGQFIDSPVFNIAYRTATQSGFTDAEGRFNYRPGESIIFSIGGIDLPGMAAKRIITPLDYSNTGSINHPMVTNMLRLLQSLDVDGNPDNGIQIGDAAHTTALGMTVLFDSATFETDVSILVANSGSVITSLIDAESARNHFVQTLAELDEQDILPVNTSTEFYYNNNSQAVRHSGSKSINGQTVTPLVHPTGGKEYFFADADRLLYYGFYSPQVVVPGFGTFTADVTLTQPETLFDVQWSAQGRSASVSGTGRVAISPTYGNRDVTYSGTVHYYGEEVVDTGIGSVVAKHIGYFLTASVNVDGATIQVPVSTELWIDSDIGIVKRIEHGQTFLLTSLSGVDSDNDGVIDPIDDYPDDPTQSTDTDGDGIEDSIDTDDDNDGVDDANDAFPTDAGESLDSDGDLIGNNADPDDDNDGVLDAADDYPLDATRSEALAINTNTLAYTRVLGASLAAGEQLIVSGDNNLSWSVTASENWISLDKNGGMGDSSLSVQINQDNLAPGNYSGTIVISDDTYGDQVVVNVALEVVLPSLTASLTALTFDNRFGWSDLTDTLTLTLNTGTNSYPWTASVSFAHQDGMTIDNSGTVGAAGSAVDVTISDPLVFSEGLFAGVITYSADVLGHTIETTVSFDVIASAHLIYVPDNGVALTSFPGKSALSKAVVVKSSYENNTTGWTATSNQAWLTVTSSGLTEGTLLITAAPAGLATDVLHEATVTIASDNPAVENTETVHVGLWIGTSDPADHTLSLTIEEIAADPVRPYVYTQGATAGQVDIYHIYQGNLVGSLSGLGSDLGDMQVSSDGQTLFVADNTGLQIVKVNLNDYTTSSWPIDAALTYGFTLARNKGHRLLIAEYGKMYDASSGSALTGGDFASGYYGRLALDASLFGNRFCGINSGLSPYTIYCHDIVFSSYDDAVQLTSLGGVPHGTGSNGRDIALSSDGGTIYIAGGAPYVFTVVDASTMTVSTSLAAEAYPTAVEVDDNDALHAGSATWYGPLDTWVYESDGTPRKSTYASGYAKWILQRQVVASGDGFMTIVVTDDPKLVFVSSY